MAPQDAKSSRRAGRARPRGLSEAVPSSADRFAVLQEPRPQAQSQGASMGSAAVDAKSRKGGRARDDVFAEIQAILDTNTTLQLSDFDFGIRQHLHAFLGAGGRQRLHDALKTVNIATSEKSRRDVKNWPAYLRKLLTKFDEKLRAKSVAAASPVKEARASPLKAQQVPEEDDEETAWLQVLSKDLSEEDRWLNELLAVEVSSEDEPPVKQASLEQTCTPVKPPMEPPKESPEYYLQKSLALAAARQPLLEMQVSSAGAWLLPQHVAAN